ncbi:hypothetical protein Y032_0019g3768 [Ancylostoma ceylanicum]|nr:hypothetical protein Y032_0019g3768 [Ancylostoma ceylanicum]
MGVTGYPSAPIRVAWPRPLFPHDDTHPWFIVVKHSVLLSGRQGTVSMITSKKKKKSAMVPVKFSLNPPEKSSGRASNASTYLVEDLDGPPYSRMGRRESAAETEKSRKLRGKRSSSVPGSVMKLSSSTPQLHTPNADEKFIFPSEAEKKSSISQKSDSGIVRDTLQQKDSWLSVEGYFTPRETMKRRKDTVQPCHDSVSTERLDVDPPRRKILISVFALHPHGSSVREKTSMDASRLVHRLLANAGLRTRFNPEEKKMSNGMLSDKDWKEFDLDYLNVAKLQLKRMSEDMKRTPLSSNARLAGASLTSLTDATRVQFSLSQTPPMAPPVQPSFSPILQSFSKE